MKVLNYPGFTTFVAALIRQHVISAVEEELKREAQVTKLILLPPDRPPPASSEATSDEKPRARRSRCKHRNQKHLKHRDN